MTNDIVEPWMQTASGCAVDLLEPKPDQIKLVDIALHLSRIPRFNGATKMPWTWSVAQHSLLVESLLPPDSAPDLRLAALLHDARKAYTGDVTSPMKAAILSYFGGGTIWRDNKQTKPDPIGFIGDLLHRAVMEAFALSPTEDWQPIIKHADLQALAIEKAQLMAPEPRPWVELPTVEAPPDLATFKGPGINVRFISCALDLIAARHGIGDEPAEA